MMDGRVAAIRDGSCPETPILAYSAKYASAFYGPFREAADSAPAFGDRRGYQMDPANVREALRECELDLAEGADVIMVKPALPYLDVIRAARERFDAAARRVQRLGRVRDGEGGGARRAGSTSGTAALESLTAIKRAGADLVISYWTKELAGVALSGRARELYRRALELIPGGVNSPVRAMRAVGLDEPLFVARGEGAYLEDVDGNALRRLGDVVGAAALRARRSRDGRGGASRPRATARASARRPRREVELAAEIVDAVPSIEKVRLVSSGTEAAMSAIRLARGFTQPRPDPQVRRLLPRPRRRAARERGLRARDARHPVDRRACRPARDRGHDRRARTTTSTRPRPRSRATARGSRRSSSSRSPGTWASSRPSAGLPRGAARARATHRARCSSSTR